MNTIPNQPNRHRISTDGLNREDSQLTLPLLRASPASAALHPAERPPPTHNPKPGSGGRGYEVNARIPAVLVSTTFDTKSTI